MRWPVTAVVAVLWLALSAFGGLLGQHAEGSVPGPGASAQAASVGLGDEIVAQTGSAETVAPNGDIGWIASGCLTVIVCCFVLSSFLRLAPPQAAGIASGSLCAVSALVAAIGAVGAITRVQPSLALLSIRRV